MQPTVAVQDLRVGMFVHLDLGWMRHPFALSSFRIAHQDQIETIRGLGLERVRWAPDKSDPDFSDPAADARAVTATPATAAAPSDSPAPDANAGQAAAQARREALRGEHEAQALAERQHSEACQALKQTLQRARQDPAAAGGDAGTLSRALVDKLLVDGEVALRLLTTTAGDRACAHGLNVAVIALLMGRGFGLTADEMMDVGVGALVHDLGKADLPERVRHMEPGYAGPEVKAYRQHVDLGVALGRRMALTPGALAVLAQHHEASDGSGFPLGLPEERTTLAARIVALVDRYDNLCNPHAAVRALTPHEALSQLFAQQRKRFDAAVFNAFIRTLGVYPAGSLVQLSDERYALVMAVNASRPLKPRVLVHDPAWPRREALLLDLEATPQLGIRRSLPITQLPQPALDYLAPRPRVAYFFEALAPSGQGEPT